MNSEIELKFLAPGSCLPHLIHLFQDLTVLQHETRELRNVYFDTPDRQLRKLGMGLRVRSCEGEHTQTLKTAGRVVGGLHERPEYNQGVSGTRPELHRFEQLDWPESTDLNQLQELLIPVFATDFERQTWLLDLDNDTLVEVAYDRGELRAEPHQEVISEIELELVKGDVTQLFILARQLCQMGQLQLANTSKARRGYQLADGLSVGEVQSLRFVPIREQDSLGQAFSACFEYTLAHWQHHEYLYSLKPELASLAEWRQGVMLLHQLLMTFEPVLHCDCPWREELLWLARQLSWLDEALSIERLLAHQGQFIKKLPKRRTLLRQLEERRQQLPTNESIAAILGSVRYATLMLDIIAWFRQGDWQRKITADESLKDFSHRILQSSWHELRQSPLGSEQLEAKQYLSLSGLLQRNLMAGIFFGNLFEQGSRDNFRLPWQDVLKGVEDIRLLQPVRELYSDLDDEDAQKTIKRWLKRKSDSLAEAMDCSRLQALAQQPYWNMD